MTKDPSYDFARHAFHPDALHPFSNSSSEKRCTAHVRARRRSWSSSSGLMLRTVWKWSAYSSGEVAWKPIRKRR